MQNNIAKLPSSLSLPPSTGLGVLRADDGRATQRVLSLKNGRTSIHFGLATEEIGWGILKTASLEAAGEAVTHVSRRVITCMARDASAPVPGTFFHTKCDLMGLDRGHLKLGVLRFFCWINQAFASKQALVCWLFKPGSQNLDSQLLLPLPLWGRVCPPRHRRNHRSLSPSTQGGRARAAKLSENEAPSRSSSFVLSSLVAWVSRFAASSVVALLCD